MSAVITAPIGAAPKPAGFVRRLFRDKPLGAAGGVIFMLFLFCGLFADVLAPFGMNEINPVNRLKAPSWQFPFGFACFRHRRLLVLARGRARG